MYMKLSRLLLVVFLLGIFPMRRGDSRQASMANDFAARCKYRGVLKCFGFDAVNQVRAQLTPAADGQIHASLDTTVKVSGAASLRFDVLPRLGANSSGAFALDFPREFGSGQEFFVQWRQRFDHEMVTHTFRKGEGWKQAIIGAGGPPPASANSCSANEVVVQNEYNRGFPQMYHSCGAKDSKYESLNPRVPPSDFLLQDAAGCRYSEQLAPRCFRYLENQWMTFQVHVKIGTWYANNSGNYHRDSTVELWVAEENKPSVLVISLPDYDLTRGATQEKYGRIWLLPYNTNKDDSEDHPIAHTWYDELIVSTRRIPDPDVATPNPPDSLSAGISRRGVSVAWRTNSENETAFLIERCSGTIYECEGSQAFSQIGSAPAQSSSFLDTSASEGKRYTYRVRASNAAGDSAYTNPATNVPRPPSDLVASVARDSVNLTWADNSADDSEVVVEGCSGIGCTNFVAMAHVPANRRQYTPPELARGKAYRFRVRSASASGSWIAWDTAAMAYSNVVAVTLP